MAKPRQKAAALAAPESLLVGSKVRAMIRAADCNIAGDALDGLNDWVRWLIDQATARAKANGRKTVRGHDFMAPR
jgi:hypothetical protein